MTTLKTHCGRCSQCLDRRFGTIAAGLQDSDPAEMYDIDLLTGPRDDGHDRTMAESYVRHARELKQMTDLAFVSRFGGPVARAATGFPDLSADQVMKNAIVLHRRHGEAVVSVLDLGFKKYARELAEGTLPGDCLLRIVGGGGIGSYETPIRDAMELPQDAPQQRDQRDFRGTSEILLALNADRKEVLIRGIPPIARPASFAVVEMLARVYEEDRGQGRAPDNYRYVGSHELTEALKVTDNTLRRRVLRLRRGVAEAFQNYLGLTLSGDAVIQSSSWQGYRIHPAVRVVAPHELLQENRSHDFSNGSHDSRSEGVAKQRVGTRK
jgi:hypothetical protein